jgi:hypothetical protein
MEGCCTFVKGIQYINPDCPVFNWSNKHLTGSIVGVVNLAFLTMFISNLSLFTLLSYTFLIYILVGIVVTQFMEKPSTE